MIRRVGNKYVLYTQDGSRVLGRHPNKHSAVMQEVAIRERQRVNKLLEKCMQIRKYLMSTTSGMSWAG